MQARNQSYLRMKNKKDIIWLLRDMSRSYSDIARVLKLSNTAVAKIADDLIADELILRDGDTKGRNGIMLRINSNYGYVFAVDLSGGTLKICAADMSSKIILRQTISEVVSFQRSDFDRVIAQMHAMTQSPQLKGKKLCCISLATPGKLNESGEFLSNPRFKGFENVTVKEELHKAFGCDVVVKNDVNLAMEGEKAYGSLKDVENALMLHIDVGTGAAFMLDGQVYVGCHGFAGEIGYFRLNMFSTESDNYDNLYYSNYFDSLSLFSALSILQRETIYGAEGYLSEYVKEKGITCSQIPIEAMLAAYRAGDPLTQKVLNSSARVIGTVANNLCELLDIDTIVLNGAVIELGQRYLDAVAPYAGNRTVQFSSLLEDATLMGALNAGLTQFFEGNI